jgi:hypothetical protein
VHLSFWLAMVIQADMRRFFCFVLLCFLFFKAETIMVSPGLPFNAQSGVFFFSLDYRRRIPTAVA